MREKRKTVDRILTIVLWVLIVANAVPLLWYGTRAFVTGRFVIKGESMEGCGSLQQSLRPGW